MKLNPSCVRDVLLTVEGQLEYFVEDNKVYKSDLSAEDIQQALPQYSLNEIVYTLLRLEEADFLKIALTKVMGGEILDCYVTDMTYQGHTFLDRIRDEARWGSVRGIVNKIGDFSLAAIGTVAEAITSAAITSLLER